MIEMSIFRLNCHQSGRTCQHLDKMSPFMPKCQQYVRNVNIQATLSSIWPYMSTSTQNVTIHAQTSTIWLKCQHFDDILIVLGIDDTNKTFENGIRDYPINLSIEPRTQGNRWIRPVVCQKHPFLLNLRFICMLRVMTF